MDKNDFLRLIKNDIVSGWPTSTVTPMTSGWNPSGKDLFIARFKVGNKRIRVEMSPSFFKISIQPTHSFVLRDKLLKNPKLKNSVAH
jgi:hypothetical protein